MIVLAGKPASKDYISYWSAGQLLAKRGNPYSYSQVLAIERTQGYRLATPIIMRNPPWALFLTLPLGWAGARVGLVLWTAALMGCIVAYFVLFDLTLKKRMLAYCFAPVVGSLASGQSSPFPLLGFSLFVYLYKKKPFSAGVALLLMAIKPHLFLVFWPLLVIDCILHKNLRLLLGGAVALFGATAVAMYLDPHVWSHYFEMLLASQLQAEFLQTPSYILRYLVAPKAMWLQFAPSLLAIGWGGWYYMRNKCAWDWRIHGMPLMLVTVLVSPYAWMTDEIILLPTIMFALSSPIKPRYLTALFMMITGVAAAMLMAQIQLSSGAYLWTSSAWFAWYLYSRPRKLAMQDELSLRPDFGTLGKSLLASSVLG